MTGNIENLENKMRLQALNIEHQSKLNQADLKTWVENRIEKFNESSGQAIETNSNSLEVLTKKQKKKFNQAQSEINAISHRIEGLISAIN